MASTFIGTHHFPAHYTQEINFPAWENISPDLLKTWLLPSSHSAQHEIHLITSRSTTVLVIGDQRDTVNLSPYLPPIPSAVGYTLIVLRDLVKILYSYYIGDPTAINTNIEIRASSEAFDNSRSIQFSSVQTLDNHIIDAWFYPDTRTTTIHACSAFTISFPLYPAHPLYVKTTPPTTYSITILTIPDFAWFKRDHGEWCNTMAVRPFFQLPLVNYDRGNVIGIFGDIIFFHMERANML